MICREELRDKLWGEVEGTGPGLVPGPLPRRRQRREHRHRASRIPRMEMGRAGAAPGPDRAVQARPLSSFDTRSLRISLTVIARSAATRQSNAAGSLRYAAMHLAVWRSLHSVARGWANGANRNRTSRSSNARGPSRCSIRCWRGPRSTAGRATSPVSSAWRDLLVGCVRGASGPDSAGAAARRSKSVDAPGESIEIEHGRHLHLTVRPTAPVQLLFTGHMDTVYGADHAFQETRWVEDGVLNGPGVADMKGGHRGHAGRAEGGRGEQACRPHRL